MGPRWHRADQQQDQHNQQNQGKHVETLLPLHASVMRSLKVYCRTGGGFSPDFLTSFSVVTVVWPLGVDTCVSDFVVDFSAHPRNPSDAMPSANIEVIIRFISGSSYVRS